MLIIMRFAFPPPPFPFSNIFTNKLATPVEMELVLLVVIGVLC